MKALVAVKRVVDANVKVRVKPDNSGVDLTNVKMSINPFDEIAVEEAVRLKEKGTVSEIVVVSIGPKEAQEQIRSAMALGADRGILVETADEIGALEVAKILKVLLNKNNHNLFYWVNKQLMMTQTKSVRCLVLYLALVKVHLHQ